MSEAPALESRIATVLGLNDHPWTAESTRIGNGQVAECHRWIFTTGDGATVSVVSKTPSADETSRSTAKLQHLYRRETSFYRELLSVVDITTPALRHVEYSEDDSFLIVLEDLTDAQSVDQFSGLSLDQATTALRELAGLHAPTMNNSDIFQRPWLGGVTTSLAPLYEAVLPALFEQFLDRYGDVIEDRTRHTVELLAQRLGTFSGYTPPFRSVIHGDYRSDNLIFGGRGGEVPLAVVDWQTVTVGSPLLDVAYFITTSLTGPDRVTHESALIDFYLDQLAERGVSIPIEVARHEYARYTLQPVVMLVAASVIVERTDRGDAMFLTMIRRAVDAVEEWEAFEELERDAPT